MPEKVTIDEALEIVRIESYGDVTPQDLQTTLALALKLHLERGISRGFVDATRVTSYPATLPIFDFGSQAVGQLRGLKIAIATSPGKREDSVFFETVTRNRGANVKVFDSPDAALAWLLEEPNQEAKGTR